MVENREYFRDYTLQFTKHSIRFCSICIGSLKFNVILSSDLKISCEILNVHDQNISSCQTANSIIKTEQFKARRLLDLVLPGKHFFITRHNFFRGNLSPSEWFALFEILHIKLVLVFFVSFNFHLLLCTNSASIGQQAEHHCTLYGSCKPIKLSPYQCDLVTWTIKK